MNDTIPKEWIDEAIERWRKWNDNSVDGNKIADSFRQGLNDGINSNTLNIPEFKNWKIWVEVHTHE